MFALLGAFVLASSTISGSTAISSDIVYPATETPLFSSIPIEKPLSIPDIIKQASEVYNVSQSVLEGVIRCESNFNPNAIGDNGHSYGLVQIYLDFHPDITKEQALDPEFAINFLAKNISNGHGYLWTCFRLLNKT